MKYTLTLLLIMVIQSSISAQNYDESKIPPYTLPDLLVANDGQKISSQEAWNEHRRSEVLKLFKQQMYGGVPEFEYDISYQSRVLNSPELAGKATREEVTITLSNQQASVDIQMLLTLPAHSNERVPVFIGLNFQGNQATSPNPEIPITTNYVIGSEQQGIVDNHATAQSRGSRAERWPLDLMLENGFGLATINCGDIDPDFDDGFKNGVHSLLATRPQPDEWGTVAAWAWGLSRAMDYFETDDRIDNNKIAVIGHSRLGKAALWAGAVDQRFALVISNDSGCGGAALSRRRIGETVEAINTQFPHWFCKNFHKYNDKEDQLPVDQHMLIALVAPRPVYVASAQDDQWADPKGEYTSLYLSSPVYNLFDLPTLTAKDPPSVDQPTTTGMQGYHMRSGKHDLTRYDWEQYIEFAKNNFR